MADDIASLGIAVNTAPVKAGYKDLDQFAASAVRMAQTVAAMDKTLGNFAASARQMSESVARMERLMAANTTAARQTDIALAKADASARQFAGGMQRLGESAQRSQQQMQKVQEQTKKSAEAMGGATVAAGRLGGTLAGIGAGITFNAVTAKIDELTQKIITAQIQTDKLNNVFAFTTGSSAGAARELEFVRNTANKLGQQVQSTAEAYGKLSAAARGSGMEGAALQRVFVGVSSAAAVMGLSAQETANAFRALEQMVSKGKVSQEELRGQLSEALPGAYQIAARAMGMSTQELGKFVEKGADAVDFVTRFGDQLEQEFGVKAVDAANKMQGAVNKLSTSWQEFWKAVASSGVADMIAKGMIGTAGAIDDVTRAMRGARKESDEGFYPAMVRLGAGLEVVLKKLANLNPLIAGWNALKPDTSVAGEMQKILDIDVQIQQLERSKPENNAFARQKLDALRAEQKSLVEKYKVITDNAQASDQLQKQFDKETRSMVKQAEVRQRIIREQRQAEEEKKDKKVKGSGRSATGDAYQAAIAEEEAFQRLMKTIYDAELKDIEFRNKIGILSDNQALMAKRDYHVKMLELEKGSVRKQVAEAERKKDLAAQKKYLGELAVLNEKIKQVNQDASQQAMLKRHEANQKAVEDMQKTADAVTKQAEAMELEVEAFGKTAVELERQAAARNDVTIAALEQHKVELDLIGASGEEIAAIEKKIEALERQRDAHLRMAEATGKKEVIEESRKAAEESARQWENAYQSISDWITDGISAGFDRGEDIIKSFVSGLKRAFSNLVLQPIIAPIASGLLSMFWPAGAAASTLQGGIGSAGSAMNFLGGAGSPLNFLGGGIERLGGYFGSPGLSQFGAGFGNPMTPLEYLRGTQGLTGTMGLGQFAGSALQAGGGFMIGRSLGQGISGGYSAFGSSGNSAVNIGSLVGSLVGPLGGIIGGALGGLFNRAFGRGPKEVTGQGLEIKYSTATGLDASNYTDWKQKGGWFRSSRRGTDRQSVDSGTQTALHNELMSMRDSVNMFAKEIGAGTNQIDGFSAHIKVAFQGTGNAAANLEALQKGLLDISDSLARVAIPNIAEYQRQGENATGALARLATEFKVTNAIINAVGRDANTAFGAVGLASIRAREQLIEFAGGIDALAAQVSYYMDNFLSDQEKLAAMQKELSPIMQQLGLSGIDSKEQFAQVVKTLDLATESGRRMFASMMMLAPAFNELATAQERVREETERQRQDLLDQLTRQTEFIWQNFTDDAAKLSRARGIVSAELSAFGKEWIITQEEFLTELTASHSRGWLDPLYRKLLDIAPVFKEMLELQQREIDLKRQAHEEEKRMLEDLQEGARSNVETVFRKVFDALSEARDKFSVLGDSIRKFNDSLLTSDISPLAPVDQYAVAKQRFESVNTRAMAGDPLAMEQLESVSREFLNLSRQMFASSDQYTRDFKLVRESLDAAELTAVDQSELMQRQINLMVSQVQGIIDLKSWLDQGFNFLIKNNYDRMIAIQQATSGVEKAIRDFHKTSIDLNNALQKAILDANQSSARATPPPPPPAPVASPPPAPPPPTAAPTPVFDQAAFQRESARSASVQNLQSAYQTETNAQLQPYQINAIMSLLDQGRSHDYILNAYLRRDIGYRDSVNAAMGTVSQTSQNLALQLIRRYLSIAEVQTLDPHDNPSGTPRYEQIMRFPPNQYAAVGLDYVPYDGFNAVLHQGERVLRASEARLMDAQGSIDFSRYGRGIDVSALSAEIRSLRAEVRSLRDDARQHTESAIRANFEATDRAANKMVDGSKDAAGLSAWREKSKSSLY